MTHGQLAQRIKTLHAEWAPLFGLGDWADESYIAELACDGLWAEVVESHWEYETFRIKYYPDLGSKDDTFIEGIVIHELAHVLIAPYRSLVQDVFALVKTRDGKELLEKLYNMHDERLTTQFAKAMRRARAA